MKLWSAYRKFLDRRAMRYGEDRWLSDALIDAEKANVFDFSGSPDSLVDAATHLDEAGAKNAPTVLDLDRFFLPFETCVAEFLIPAGEVDPDAKAQVGDSGGRILGLVSRPDGHTMGFGLGEMDWPMMIVSQPANLPNSFRILKVVLSSERTKTMRPIASTRSETKPFGLYESPTDSRFSSFLYSCCDYEVNTGKCINSWHHTDDDDIAEPWKRKQAKKDSDSLRTAATHYACWSLAMLETANSPANWVVEVRDEHARIVKRRGKKAEDTRTRYIVVPDRDLDKVIRRSNEGSDYIEKSPHRRRAHYRRLNSPFYRLKRGKRVLVKESWVGKKDSTHSGSHYRVLTSLPCGDEVK